MIWKIKMTLKALWSRSIKGVPGVITLWSNYFSSKSSILLTSDPLASN